VASDALDDRRRSPGRDRPDAGLRDRARLLTPPAAVAGLAERMGAPYELIPASGHSEILLKQPEAIAVAERIRQWLDRDLAR
jgi:hypothetical protein